MYIYLIEHVDNHETLYKIGISKNSKQRLKNLRTGNPGDMQILYEYKTNSARRIETVLHNQFSYCHVRGEFFRLSLDDVSKFLESCKKIDINIEFLKENNHFWK